MEKINNSTMLPGVVKPQKKRADRAELTGGIEETVVAERDRYLLSLRKPKKDEATMPGMLNKASIRVLEV